MSTLPNFEHRDAADSAFWNERFEKNFTPWDKGDVPIEVRSYFAGLKTDSSNHCLIPGCGNGYEAAYLSELGWDVVAIDFAPAAVASARAKFAQYRDRIIEADFFTYQPTKPLRVIYERAFFCALPPDWRTKIVARWAKLLPASSLLIGFFYIADATGKDSPPLSGPPFAISQQELTKLLSPYFVCLEDKSVADSIPIFNGQERWQIWQRC